jgi:hypothetical protein
MREQLIERGRLIDAALADLWALIYLLRDTPVQSLEKARSKEIYFDHLQTGKRPRPSSAARTQPRAPDELGAAVQTVHEMVDLWFRRGRPMPRQQPERIALLLQRAGALELERAYLAVFCYHFARPDAEFGDALTERAKELGVYPLPLRRQTVRETNRPERLSSAGE